MLHVCQILSVSQKQPMQCKQVRCTSFIQFPVVEEKVQKLLITHSIAKEPQDLNQKLFSKKKVSAWQIIYCADTAKDVIL